MKGKTNPWVPVLAGILALAGVQAQAVEKSILLRVKGQTGSVVFGLDEKNTDSVLMEVWDTATPPNRIQSMQKDKQSKCWLKRNYDYTVKFSCTTGSFTAKLFAADAVGTKIDEGTKSLFTASASVLGKDVKITPPSGGKGLPVDANSSMFIIGER